jgi:hypothetical protein
VLAPLSPLALPAQSTQASPAYDIHARVHMPVCPISRRAQASSLASGWGLPKHCAVASVLESPRSL